MQITPSNLNLFFTTLDVRYNEAFHLTPTWWEQIATLYPTSTETWGMGWIGMLDKLRVWNGPRVVHSPAPQTYFATPLPFELTESISKWKLQDDTYGVYYPFIDHMGEQSKKWPDYQVRDLLQGNGPYAGAAQIGTDLVTHWNTAHPVDFYDAAKGTYCNDYGASGFLVNGVTVGGAVSVNAYKTVWADMASRKNESGETWGLVPDKTMYAAQRDFEWKTIVQNGMFAPPQLGSLGSGSGANAPFVGAMDNPMRGSTDLFMNPDISNQPDAWYQMVTKKAIKPFGWVLRMAPMMIPRVDPTDPAVFDLAVFLYGVEARGIAAWGLPAFSSRSGV